MGRRCVICRCTTIVVFLHRTCKNKTNTQLYTGRCMRSGVLCFHPKLIAAGAFLVVAEYTTPPMPTRDFLFVCGTRILMTAGAFVFACLTRHIGRWCYCVCFSKSHVHGRRNFCLCVSKTYQHCRRCVCFESCFLFWLHTHAFVGNQRSPT